MKPSKIRTAVMSLEIFRDRELSSTHYCKIKASKDCNLGERTIAKIVDVLRVSIKNCLKVLAAEVISCKKISRCSRNSVTKMIFWK